jgi:oligopeptide transport system substrate-binding protein
MRRVLLSVAVVAGSSMPIAAHAAPAPLRVAIGAIGTVDPADAANPAETLVARTLCDSLLRVDPVTGELRAGLVRSWLVSDGGRRLTLRLRHGVRFSNGQRVTADDAAYALSRAASESFAGSQAALLEPVEGYDEIHGDRDATSSRHRRRLAGVTVVSEGSLEIALRRPDAEFLRVLAAPVAAPVPRRLATRAPEQFHDRPVCAGPYRLADAWHPGAPVITLHSMGGRGAIEFHITGDRAAGVAAWRTGEVDVAAADAATTGDDVVAATGPHVEFVGVPSTAPFDQPRVRRALSRALDRTAIASAGGRFPASRFLPPAAGPVTRRRSAACAAAVPAVGDAAAARADLDRVGVDLRGTALPLLYNDELGNRPVVEAVAKQWHDAFGLDVQLVAEPWNLMLRDLTGAQPYAGAFRMGWTPPVTGPDAYLAPLFSSDGAIGTTNLARVTDSGFDRALTRDARRPASGRDRLLEYRRLEERLCRRLPLIPVTFSQPRWLVRGGAVRVPAHGDVLDRATATPRLRELVMR